MELWQSSIPWTALDESFVLRSLEWYMNLHLIKTQERNRWTFILNLMLAFLFPRWQDKVHEDHHCNVQNENELNFGEISKVETIVPKIPAVIVQWFKKTLDI